MGIFDRFKKVNSSIPSFAAVLSQEEYEHFVQLCRGFFDSRQIPTVYHFDEGYIEINSNQPEQRRFGLFNVVHEFKSETIDEREAVITEWFEQVLATQSLRDQLHKMNFEEVRDNIEVSLFCDSEIEKLDWVRIAPDVVAAPVAGIGHAWINLSRQDAATWGHSFDDLIRLGLENSHEALRSGARVACHPEDSPIAGTKVIADPNSRSVASNILQLESVIQFNPKFGYVAGIPTRSFLFAYPLELGSPASVLEELHKIAIRVHDNQPNAITDSIFWVRGGEILDLGLNDPDQPNDHRNELCAIMGWD